MVGSSGNDPKLPPYQGGVLTDYTKSQYNKNAPDFSEGIPFILVKELYRNTLSQGCACAVNIHHIFPSCLHYCFLIHRKDNIYFLIHKYFDAYFRLELKIQPPKGYVLPLHQ